MMRMARILVVEPEANLRQELNEQLEDAGHDVAVVQDEEGAERLLEEGLDPDVVIAEVARPQRSRPLRDLAPEAAHLRLDREIAPQGENPSLYRCPAEAAEVLRRLEQILLEHERTPTASDDALSIDLARRLANCLPHARTAEERISLVTEEFDAVFGVRGTLVVRRGPQPGDWIEASQGLSDSVATRISAEIARRSTHRGIRPFLTTLRVDDEPRQIACVAVQLGPEELDLALDLIRSPKEARVREAMMNLVGSTMRAASTAGKLQHTRRLLEAQSTSFESLLEMSREFTSVGHRGALCEKILAALRRELGLGRSALFLPRQESKGLLELRAAYGFSEVLLERIGLSRFHGLGKDAFEASEVRTLVQFSREGASGREIEKLSDAGLQWACPIALDDLALGLLFFGGKEGEGLSAWELQFLAALTGSAAVALRNLESAEDLHRLSIGSLKALVGAVELCHPEDRGHADRVGRLSTMLGKAAGLSEEEVQNLAFSAFLHDVGRIGEPAGDTARGKMHPMLGSRILSHSSADSSVIQGIEQHHERYDGRGYPYGLKGDGIHVFARIIAIVNAFDRIRHGSDEEVASGDVLRELARGAGLQFDPGLTALFTGEISHQSAEILQSSGDDWLEAILGIEVQ